ncbi:MAG: hypothetical protein RL095_3743 [Verrucomicrobiota bacterium]
MIRESGRHVKVIKSSLDRKGVNFGSSLSSKAANDGQAIITRIFAACQERAAATAKTWLLELDSSQQP